MRRKRKSKYIWLPMLGAEPNAASLNPDQTESNGFSFSCTTNAGVGSVNLPGTMALFPLVEDTPQEEATTANPDPVITDFIGTDYVVKRIVGKCFLNGPIVAADTYFRIAVTCGLFVARADDQNPLTPNGATTQALAQQNFDPNYVDNIREPWIWRRTWIFSNGLSTNATAVEKTFANGATSNQNATSMMDGPHVDAKSARRIRSDERLWFSAVARGISLDGLDYATPPAQASTVAGYLDLRCLGALRRAKNRSNF